MIEFYSFFYLKILFHFITYIAQYNEKIKKQCKYPILKVLFCNKIKKFVSELYLHYWD